MRRYGLRDDQRDRIKDLLPGREGSVGVTVTFTTQHTLTGRALPFAWGGLSRAGRQASWRTSAKAHPPIWSGSGHVFFLFLALQKLGRVSGSMNQSSGRVSCRWPPL
jgi:hypothetical protein